jgi:hypothetical protein
LVDRYEISISQMPMDLWILLFPLSQTILLPDLTIGVTRPVSDKNQAQLLTINEQTG